MNKRQKKIVSLDYLNDNRAITRSMSLSENGNENSLPFPIDIIITIFLKLSLKSIARCRCVSKLWASILRRSDFTELFLSRSSLTSPKLLFVLRNKSAFFIFSSPQPQKHSSHVVSNYQMKFSLNDYYVENFEYVNGLICLKDLRMIKRNKEIVLKICNPSTGQVLILPKLKTRRYQNMCSVFGYDPIGKQFKVLAMTKGVKLGGMCDEYQVLTLGSGNMSWKMIDCIPHGPPWNKKCINGMIYYMSYDRLMETRKIVCFDVRFEKFSFIETAEIINGSMMHRTLVNLINYNGKLGLLQCKESLHSALYDGRSISFKLWVLEDLEKQVWSYHLFLFPPMPEKFVKKDSLYFLGVTQTNEIVLTSSRYKGLPFDLFYLNLEKKTIARVTIQGI